MENEQPVTLVKVLKHEEENPIHSPERIKGINIAIELVDEWMDYIDKVIKKLEPIGHNGIVESDELQSMYRGLKRFKGKILK